MPEPMETLPDTNIRTLGILAGRGVYPALLAESARAQGVTRIVAFAFKGETDRRIERYVDTVHWLRLGRLADLLDGCRATAMDGMVMAGQIKPTHLFNLRLDKAMWQLLAHLETRNAHTIFGAVAEQLQSAGGVRLLEAHRFMTRAMPAPGTLAGEPPTAAQQADIALGLEVAKQTSALDIGQTVVIKQGTILAIEAFEGTDETILRAGRLGGPGGVVVKVAKQGHDMRFDIPVIGERTLRKLKKAKAAVLAVEAHRTILLDREALCRQAARQGLRLLAISTPPPPSHEMNKKRRQWTSTLESEDPRPF